MSGDLDFRLQRQQIAYRETVGACVQEPACDGVSFAGLTDAESRIRNSGDDGTLLFTSSYAPKPAYTGVLQAFQGS
jgi:hypothetical protein